ncbi:MAG: hypothetical protein ACTSXA_11495 [Candidatus Heimdallarchaeota archaeon]
MTTIVETPMKYKSNIKKISDSQEEFQSLIKSSKFITYTVENFADCFSDSPTLLKAIQVRLYQLPKNKRPIIDEYLISWEDLPRNDVESWDDFKRKVHLYLKDFIVKLNDNTNIIEGSMI